jgi:Domain of unknown function (DU1801)
MAELKTRRTTASVTAFLSAIPDPDRRKDARALAALIRKATGKAPAMWGPAIVGYGETTYEGSGGRTGLWFPVGFAPRKAALTLYLMGGLKAHASLLKQLGAHKVGGGCLYIRRLADVDTKVLSRLIAKSAASNAAKPPSRAGAKPTSRKRAVQTTA